MNPTELIKDLRNLIEVARLMATSSGELAHHYENNLLQGWNELTERYWITEDMPEQVSESEDETHFDYEDLIRLTVWCLGCTRATAKKHLKEYLNG